jgi:hypothetical protein
MQRSIEFYGSIDDTGVLKVTNRPRMQEWCRANAGKDVILKIERKYKKRSSLQNRYYHGVVVTEVRLAFLNLGHDLSADETHFFLKQKFNTVQVPGVGGEAIEVPGSTTEMTTFQFMEYLDKITRWSAEYLGIVIPAPNESLQFKF